VRTLLSPRWGLLTCHFHPRLAPWAALLRRFAAARREVCFIHNIRIQVLKHTRAGFINSFQLEGEVPQGLKPAFFQALSGTAEAVPCPKPIYETSSRPVGLAYAA